MNGIHDLGGMDGFGPVEVEPDEPVFHEQWERTVFATTLGRGTRNVHRFRHAIERMDPAHYLASSYYEHWLTGVATLLVEDGAVTPEELEARVGGRFPLSRPVAPLPPPELPAPGAAPRFAVGSAVRVANAHPLGHTRCPRYVRGKRGVVVRLDGSFPVPDVAAHAGRSDGEPTYAVRFTARELWGAAAGARETVHVDLWERWLEPA
ncbi:MAG TPA: nitrile hydratase subunit beta [Candidatus Binatia bacterium]|nr:nitrile hydratase subunit beta [Candidatus Binatia bacterium]